MGGLPRSQEIMMDRLMAQEAKKIGDEKANLQALKTSPKSEQTADAEINPCEDRSSVPRTKQSNGQDVAAILASYRRSAQQGDSKHPNIPKRTVSTSQPAKRKRHEDFVAFHRNSCQLFSSLDGTLSQMRLSASSSSSSSSSSFPSPSSTPKIGLDTRDNSIDFAYPRPMLGSKYSVVTDNRSDKPRLVAKRPVLQRMSYTVSPQESQLLPDFIPTPVQIQGSPTIESDSGIPLKSSPTISSQGKPLARPPTITTHSCYSSQTTLPLALAVPADVQTNPTSTTTIHWTSPETRQKEYAKIDAANSGLRLFFRRVFPRSMCRKVGGGRAAFWDEIADTERDDAMSVRRFRLSVEGEEREKNTVEVEIGEQGVDHGKLEQINEKTIEVGIDEVELQNERHRPQSCNAKIGAAERNQARTDTEMSSNSRSSSTPLLPHTFTKRSSWKKILNCCS